MDKRYTRLKLKMLLLIIIGTVVAIAAGVFLLEVVMDGILQDPFARGFLWVARNWFGYDETGAAHLYQVIIRDHKAQIMTAGSILLMLGAFYLAMGRFTTWLDQISFAVRQVVNETGTPVKLPKELSPVEDDLLAILRILRKREAAARESEQRKSDLVAFLAHDLKTPLTSVLGYLSLLNNRTDLSPEQRAKYLSIALDKAERLEELISEFFDISRMDLQNLDCNDSVIQLSLLLEQLADEFYPVFSEKGLSCRTEIAPQLTTTGDPDKLARVFDNVLRNAVSYSTPGGQVEICAVGNETWVEISVHNQGLEIPEQELSNIFNKFYRLDQARSTRTGGAELGLAIAREIVERHGGSIRAERDGKQTSFVICIPAASPDGDGGSPPSGKQGEAVHRWNNML